MTTILKIADFSDFPAGRSRDRDRYSGEEYRDDILIPALKKGKVVISFDGIYACVPTFLEEVFGGLLRHGISFEEVRERLVFAEPIKDKHNKYIYLCHQFINEQNERNQFKSGK